MDFGFHALSLHLQSDGTISSFLGPAQQLEQDHYQGPFYPGSAQLPWTRDISHFARSGTPQLSILVVSIICTTFNLVRQRRSPCCPRRKTYSVPCIYEALSQLSRAAAVAFLAAAYIQANAHLLNIVVLAYGLALGLLRLVGDADWRHAALHQVNFVYSSLLVVLFAGQFLPCVQIGVSCSRHVAVIGGIASLFVHSAVAFVTPREWRPPHAHDDLPVDIVEQGPSPEEVCSWFTYYCSYAWMDSLIWKGTRKVLDMAAVFKLPWYDEPRLLLRRVQRARSISRTTLWTTLRYQRSEMILMAIWSTLSFIVENVAPYSTFKLLDYLSAPEQATYKPWVWLLLVFAGPILRSIFYQGYIFSSTRLLVRIKSGMTQELYHRALESMELEDDPFQKGGGAKKDNASPKTTSAGRLATLMASDIDAIFRARDVVMMVTGIPAGTAVSLYGMHRMMGWPSLVGTAVLILATPVSFLLGRLMFKSQAQARRAQDSRLSLVTEYLASIHAIKYFAWEIPITDLIDQSRAREQKQLWRVSVFQVIINQVTQVFPFLSLLVMFGLYAGLKGKRLEASVAFTTVFLVRNIRRNIVQASYYMRAIAAALVAFDRLDKYFDSTVPKQDHGHGPLHLQKACFRRAAKASFRLEDISVNFVEGGLNVVSGPSGSGKTTLLLAILGETYHEEGQVTRPHDVAFASQSAWLQNETVKENILFTGSMDQTRYDRVIQACRLSTDLAELSHGDETAVGENGTSLSGGQRARVALARALYSQAPVLLLDDIFSALDATTAAGLWRHCFCSDLLKGRTTVLVTQVPWIPPQADLSVSLESGRIRALEQNLGVTRRPITVAEALGGGEDADDDTTTPVNGSAIPSDSGATSPTKPSLQSPANNLIDQETRQSGQIGRLTFLQYMTYFGHPLFAITLIFSLVIVGMLSYFSTYWLSIWVEAYNNQAHIDIAYYLGIYTSLAISEIMVYAVVILMFEWGAWRAAKRLHHDFVRAVLRVDLSWFKNVPIGRITNRFAGDMTSIDSALSGMLRIALEAIVMLVFRLLAVSAIMPVFVIPALFTVLIGVVLAEMYTRTAVVMKRLSSSSQSPIFSQFADTLAGLPVIRARADMAETFKKQLVDKMRVWSAVAESNFNCNRWVAVRVDFVTALVVLCAGMIAVSQVGRVPAGLVGFSLTNANLLSMTILALVRAMNDLEVEMQSFHRVREYVKLESEEENDTPSPEEGTYVDSPADVIPSTWPASGEIEFRDATVRYSPDGPDILTNVNLKFQAGQRVAVVGRTGSGKSTLMLSLLRFTYVVSGQILYDGIDITKLPRSRLRESLTIIPQEAVLFNGTVRSNLDPTGLIPDAILQDALDHCKSIASFSSPLTSSRSSTVDGETNDDHGNDQSISLDTSVDARGDNFSHGQRQVLSLCRALIRRSRLMLLDEATASMDYKTDRGLQDVLRQELVEQGGGRTLVTIAHRLRTIIDYDAVVVMSAGRVVEYGSPKRLYESKGLFYDMVRHSGEIEDLVGILEAGKQISCM